MPYREPPRRITGWAPTLLVAGFLLVAEVISGVRIPAAPSLAHASTPASAISPAASGSSSRRSEPGGALGEASGIAAPGAIALGPRQRGRLDQADGILPDRTTVFDTSLPGIANLDPELLGALRRAASDAAHDGLELFVTSGWRSREYQEQLFRQAVSNYGSEEKAAHWVALPGTSAHEQGNAVDVGPSGTTAWLSEQGARYGLCQIYVNEPWHYELRPEAIDHGCPRMYADPTHAPAIQQ